MDEMQEGRGYFRTDPSELSHETGRNKQDSDRVWPSLPLPSTEEYENVLQSRVNAISERFCRFLDAHAHAMEGTGNENKGAASESAEQHSSLQRQPTAESSRVCLQHDTVPIEIFSSPARHFRARCRFAVLKDSSDGKFHYYLYDGGTPSLLADAFPAACIGAYRMMPCVLDALNADAELQRGVKAVHFLTTKSGSQCLITLVYEIPLEEGWKSRALALKRRCEEAGGTCVSVLGRSKGVVLQVGNDGVTEELTVNGRRLQYFQVEGSFSNPNPFVNEKCLGWLCSCADLSRAAQHEERTNMEGQEEGAVAAQPTSQLLELYCGNGNHTCALAPRFDSVVAVEINKELCKAAEQNLTANGVTNARVLCSPSHRFCLKLLGGYGQDNALLTSFETVLVDPPRAGLDIETCRLVAKYRHVMYISCNPEALLRDLEILSDTHEVLRFAVFDHFPFTRHIECGVLLSRRK